MTSPAEIATERAIIQTPLAKFEEGLFRQGAYTFDLKRETSRLTEGIAKRKAWFEQNPHWDEKRTARDMIPYIRRARYELMWLAQVDGKIPQRWVNCMKVAEDFDQAGELHLQLNDYLINAAVTHPDHLIIINHVAETQKLNMVQLAAALAIPLPPGEDKKIINSQIARGIPQKDIEIAQKRAQEMNEKMWPRERGPRMK